MEAATDNVIHRVVSLMSASEILMPANWTLFPICTWSAASFLHEICSPPSPLGHFSHLKAMQGIMYLFRIGDLETL